MKTKGTGGLGKIKVIGDLGKRSCSGVVEKQVKERTGVRKRGQPYRGGRCGKGAGARRSLSEKKYIKEK